MTLICQIDEVTWLADVNGMTYTVYEFEGMLALGWHIMELRLSEGGHPS